MILLCMQWLALIALFVDDCFRAPGLYVLESYTGAFDSRAVMGLSQLVLCNLANGNFASIL